MPCEVEYTDEFEAWWNSLRDDEQESISAIVAVLGDKGIALSFPYSSGVESSRHSHMRELRIQHRGRPFGGCKAGNDKWYKEHVPKADKIYEDHLKSVG